MVGIAATLPPPTADDRLGRVHDAAAAEGDDVASAHLVQQRGRGLGHGAGGHVQVGHRAVQRAGRDLRPGPLGGQQHPVAAEAGVAQQLRRVRGHAVAEADDPLAVAEEERRLAHAVGAGSVVSAGWRWSVFSPASVSATALVSARR